MVSVHPSDVYQPPICCFPALCSFRYPVDYYESMNTVLCQELVRFNRLITTIHTTLTQLQKALKGEHLCSAVAAVAALAPTGWVDHNGVSAGIPVLWRCRVCACVCGG